MRCCELLWGIITCFEDVACGRGDLMGKVSTNSFKVFIGARLKFRLVVT